MPKRRTDRSSVHRSGRPVRRSRSLHVLALLVLALLAFVPGASAQDLREKTIRIVVPFLPGGSADTLARLVSQQITQTSGQKFVVENRPGAGTVIATEAVARSAPDGTTVLIMSNSFVINGIVRATLPYDPLTSFEPVCFLVDSPQVLVVNAAAPHRSLKDLVDAAKAKPASSPMRPLVRPPAHIAGEMFKQAAGINLTYALCGRRAGGECAPRRSRRHGARQLQRGERAAERRQAAAAGGRLARAHQAAARGAHLHRAGLQ